MDDATPFDDYPSTEAEFHSALGSLVQDAADNGVDVIGSWNYRDDPSTTGNWSVEILPLAPGTRDE